MDKIIHGDCVEQLRKVPGHSVELVLTDPPYGDDMPYGRGQRTIAGNANPLVGLSALAECYRILKRNRNAYFFLDVKHLPFIRTFVEQYTDFRIKDWLVWDKTHMGMGQGFRKQHEMILVLEKGKPRYRNLGLANVLSEKRTSTVEHPHKKPIDLLCKLIEQSTDVGDLVLDPFLGSGSTAVAAKLIGRKYIGIEREPKYVAIAKARLLSARPGAAGPVMAE